MKLKSLLWVSCFSFLSCAFADNHSHGHPEKFTTNNHATAVNSQPPTVAGPCQIEIINDSYDDIRVYGRFDDNTPLTPFTIRYWGQPEYISLYFAGYCHQGMDLYIDTVNGKYKYNGFTPAGKTVRIPSW